MLFITHSFTNSICNLGHYGGRNEKLGANSWKVFFLVLPVVAICMGEKFPLKVVKKMGRLAPSQSVTNFWGKVSSCTTNTQDILGPRPEFVVPFSSRSQVIAFLK